MHIATNPAVLALFAVSTQAYTATQRTYAVNYFYGATPLVEGRMDPIVNPGVAAGHVHTVQGGNAFALTMTDNQALDDSTCTSSLAKSDLSNYWVPKLYFQAENGTFHDVDLFYMKMYYFFEGTTDKIVAFPPGHRIVSGSPTLRTPPATGGRSITDQADGVPQPVQWTCPRSDESTPLYPTDSDGLHGVGIQDPSNGGAGAGFPDKNCDGYASPLRADIHFPSCYDPSQDNTQWKTNMEFPTNGNCPEGWTHYPHLFMEAYWNTPKFEDEWTPGQGKQPFVLSQGDPTGYGLHADFISGWDVAALQQIIDNCDSGNDGIDKCPGLIGGVNDPADNCVISSPIDEVILGSLSKLPGDNPITGWGSSEAAPAPAPAPVSSAKPPVTSAKPPVASSKPPTAPIATPIKVPSSPKVDPSPPASGSPTKVIGVTHAISPSAASPIPTPKTTPNEGGGSNTLVISYVTETDTIWTTVTEPYPPPTPSPTTDSSTTPGFIYKGCFADHTDARVLSGITFADVGLHSVTNTKCTAYCDARGFSLAGTQYGGQCFCGDQLVGSAAVPEDKCNMACEGDGTQTCGGSLTLSVYSKEQPKLKRSRRHFNHHVRVYN